MGHCKASREPFIGTFKTFLFLFALLSSTQAFSAPTIGAVTVNANPVSQYTKFELTFPITT